MKLLRNTAVYTVFAGGGSIALTYLVPAVWRTLAIASVVLMAVALAVQALVSDDGASGVRLQLSPTRRPDGSDSEVETDDSSVFYYALGTLLFGTLAVVVQHGGVP